MATSYNDISNWQEAHPTAAMAEHEPHTPPTWLPLSPGSTLTQQKGKARRHPTRLYLRPYVSPPLRVPVKSMLSTTGRPWSAPPAAPGEPDIDS